MGPWTLLLTSTLATAPMAPWPADLQPLLAALNRHRFTLKLQPPPRRGVYGLFDPTRRTIWVAPITIALGIARQTLLHEATHAAQSCPGGVVRPIGWQLQLSPVIEREITRITHANYGSQQLAIEREAFTVQGQTNAVALIVQALDKRCQR